MTDLPRSALSLKHSSS